MQTDWIIPESCLQILRGGYRVSVVELDLLLLYALLDLLKFFSKTDWRQHIVVLVV